MLLTFEETHTFITWLIHFSVAKHAWMFEEASVEIIKLFPNEQKETYYIPYKKKTSSSPKKAPRGRLWSRYHNVRNSLRISEKTTSRSKGHNSSLSLQDIDENGRIGSV